MKEQAGRSVVVNNLVTKLDMVARHPRDNIQQTVACGHVQTEADRL